MAISFNFSHLYTLFTYMTELNMKRPHAKIF